jgi:formylglycine-generating enzyme required for sulfatase activity
MNIWRVWLKRLALALSIALGTSILAHADDCLIGAGLCPSMVRIPAGNFQMGDLSGHGEASERPLHEVSIPSFWLGATPVTFAQYDACVRDGSCPKSQNPQTADDAGWGRGNRPVINVSLADVDNYISWLSRRLHADYRLPSEAEYEYAARGGTTTDYWWGNQYSVAKANFSAKRTEPVAAFPANPFGLFDIVGNVLEWTADCWHTNYQGAPVNGSAWVLDCQSSRYGTPMALRGGSWILAGQWTRSAARFSGNARGIHYGLGFRVARSD